MKLWTALLTTIFLVGCSDIPTPGILKNLIYEDENTTCFDDGFDTLCITAVDGKDGIDGINGESIIGPPGKDGSDGSDGIDGESIIGPPGPPGRDGTTTVIHRTKFRYVDIPHPEPEPEPTPVIPTTPPPKRIVVEAVVHPTESVHPIPAETLHVADQIVHVSHLTEARHTQIPNNSEIWHIAIYDTGAGVDLYVYPRSLPPNDRLDFHSGEGTELQGTRAGVNELLRMFLEEHNTHIDEALGDLSIIDESLL